MEKGAVDLYEIVNEVVSEAKRGNRGGSGNRGYTVRSPPYRDQSYIRTRFLIQFLICHLLAPLVLHLPLFVIDLEVQYDGRYNTMMPR